MEDDWERKRRERAEEEEEEKEKLELEKFREEKLTGRQENLGFYIHEEEYHLNDEETLLTENPEIFRKSPPIRPRVENEDEKDGKDIPKEWTPGNSRIEPGQDEMENATVIPFQKDVEDGAQEDGPGHEDT